MRLPKADKRWLQAATMSSSDGKRPLKRTFGSIHDVSLERQHTTRKKQQRFRHKLSTTIIDGIFQRLRELEALTLPSEPLHKAIHYGLNQRGVP